MGLSFPFTYIHSRDGAAYQTREAVLTGGITI